MQNFIGKVFFTIFLNRAFDNSVAIASEMLANSCFLGIMAGLTDIRFTIDAIRDSVDRSHTVKLRMLGKLA